MDYNLTTPLTDTFSDDNYSTSTPSANVTEAFYDSDLRLGFYTKADDYAIGGSFIFIAVLGVVLNSLTILIIGFGKRMSKEVKIQLINLAVADIITALFFPALTMLNMLELSVKWSLPMCRLARFAAQSALHASPLCNAVIGLERFVIVYFPFRAAGYTRTHKFIIVVAIWVCSCLPEIETLVYAQILYYEGEQFCDVASPFTENYPILNEWILTLKYVIPALIMIISYALVFIRLSQRKRSRMNRHSSKSSNSKIETVQVMLVVDTAITLLTWLPYNLYISVTESYIDQFLASYTVRQVYAMDVALAAILATNAFSSPIVYYIFNRHFRRDTKGLFMRCCGISDDLLTQKDPTSNISTKMTALSAGSASAKGNCTATKT